MASELFVDVQNLTFPWPDERQGEASLFSSLTFSLPQNAFLQLTGVSGVGKSTLLNILSGLRHGYGGRVRIGNYPPHHPSLSVAYVLQGYGLLPWKKVMDNILLPRYLDCPFRSREEVDSIIHLLGLEPLLNRYPGTLSGGQRQRVALARSFAQKADLLLLDEPFAALDPQTGQEALGLLLQLRRLHPVTTIMATHHTLSPSDLEFYSLHLLSRDYRWTSPSSNLQVSR